MEDRFIPEREIVAALRAVTVNLRARLAKLEARDPNPQSVVLNPASNDILLTNVDQDVLGCSVDIGPGTYLVEATFDIQSGVNANDNGQTAICSLLVNGVADSRTGVVNLLNDGTTRLRQIIHLAWKLDLPSLVTVKLQVRKSGGTGGAQLLGGNTIMTARLIAVG